MINYTTTISLICVLALHDAYGMEQSFIQSDSTLKRLHEQLKCLPPEIQDITHKLDHAFRDYNDYDMMHLYLVLKINSPDYVNPHINPVLQQVGITNDKGHWDMPTGMLINRALAYPLVIDLLKHPFRKKNEEEDERYKILTRQISRVV